MSNSVTYYLRFDDTAAAEAALAQAGWLNDGSAAPQSGYLWDELQPVVITDAVLDGQGNVVAPAVMDSGCYVNVYDLDGAGCPAAFEDARMSVEPSNPLRRLGEPS